MMAENNNNIINKGKNEEAEEEIIVENIGVGVKILLSIDIGFGMTKFIGYLKYGDKYNLSKFYKIKSSLIIYNHNKIFDIDSNYNNKLSIDEISKDIYDHNGIKYIIGDNGSDNNIGVDSTVHLVDIDDLINKSPIFVNYALKQIMKIFRISEESIDKIYISTGLPLLASDEQKQALRSTIKKNLKNIYKVNVYTQGVGIALEDEASSIMAVDIGHNTMDIIVKSNNYFIEDECISVANIGIQQVCDGVVRYVLKEYNGMKLTTSDVQNLLNNKDKVIIYLGKKYDISSVVHQFLREWNSKIFNNLMEFNIQRINKSEKIILGGGGSYYINKELIPKKIKDIVKICKNPEFANCRGFLAAGINNFNLNINKKN